MARVHTEAAWLLLSAIVAAAFAFRGYKKRSLSKSGALAAFVVGSTTASCGLRYAATLIVFYISGSKATTFRSEEKSRIEAGFVAGGQRNWIQVVSNSLTGTLLALFLVARVGWNGAHLDCGVDPVATRALAAFLAHYACCAGDTWASELGILSRSNPRLITTWKLVHRGTNGAISSQGTLLSAMGGGLVGAVFLVTGMLTVRVPGHTPLDASLLMRQWRLLPLGVGVGLLGSLADSLLGATLQFSGFCRNKQKVVSKPGPSVTHISGYNVLNNHAVNLISSALMAAAAWYFACVIF
eukprot:jgi/Mesvir1/3570/Mv12034-RA.1